MKNRYLHRTLALLLAAAMALGLCACSRAGSYVEPPKTQAPSVTEASQHAGVESEPKPSAEPAGETGPEPTEEPSPEPTEEPVPEPTEEPFDGETLVDEDGDGIISYKCYYKGSTVYALFVLDPSRVYVGTAQAEPGSYGQGLTLDVLAEQYGAVAAINAGGFKDEDGVGKGWPPNGITFSRGVCFEEEQYGPIIGLDHNEQMWTGYYDYESCRLIGIRDAVTFGPYLVAEGEKVDPDRLEKGICARTAIGQRADGTVVLVAIDGRQGYSIGVSLEDLADIMADKFGCVTASNMDGGNSTSMIFYGETMNQPSNQAGGTRNMPDAWLVDPLPEDYVRPAGVPDSIRIPTNALGEQKEYVSECDDATKKRLYTFAWVFTTAYYGYFGTPYYERHYSDLLQHVAQDCDLRTRAEQSLEDRRWVNTWNTEPSNIVMDGAYVNEDGSYDILLTLDVTERSGYWTYVAKGIQLRITVIDAPKLPYGFLATDTY